MTAYILTLLFLALAAPLLSGLIRSLKMVLLYRRPVSVFQEYRTFSKLLAKETLVSEENSQITRVAPYLVLSPLLVALLFLPPALSLPRSVSLFCLSPRTGAFRWTIPKRTWS